jgi:phosphate transport system permease protein
MKAILSALALLVMGLFVGLVGLLVVRGASGLSLDFLFTLPARAGREGGILPVLVSTVYLVGGALGFSVPIGLGTALYMQEYAQQGAMVRAVRTLTEALASLPSILYGLFGFSLFVIHLHWGWSLASGSVTLALMILPTMIRTAEESLASVSRELREGAAALGATRWQTSWRIVLRVAAPGILTGAILGMGRALGETAAVLLTAGSDLGMPTSPLGAGRSLAVHLYILASEGLSDERAYATALALVLGVLVVNITANLLLERWRHA